MKREALAERMELLEIGEALGYPRLGYGRSTRIPHDRRIPAGQPGWEKFAAHAHVNRILPALRISRVLRDNGIAKFHPLSSKEEVMPDPTRPSNGPVAPSADMTAGAPASPSPAPDLLDEALT